MNKFCVTLGLMCISTFVWCKIEFDKKELCIYQAVKETNQQKDSQDELIMEFCGELVHAWQQYPDLNSAIAQARKNTFLGWLSKSEDDTDRYAFDDDLQELMNKLNNQ